MSQTAARFVEHVDMRACPNRDGGEFGIIAATLERPVIETILMHLGLDPIASGGVSGLPGQASGPVLALAGAGSLLPQSLTATMAAQSGAVVPGRLDAVPFTPRPPQLPRQTMADAQIPATPGPASVAVQRDNLAPINTGTITTQVVLQIQGDDAEMNVAVARAVLGATLQAAPVDPARKAALIEYYGAIAQTLERAAEVLRQGRIPHGMCGELRAHAEHLPAVAGDVIGPDVARAMAGKLLECYEVERFGHQFMRLPPAERDERFALLDDAAGYLRASGQALRVRR